MDKVLVDTFLKDPNWPLMQKFIEEHFKRSMDIADIDATLESSVIHAEVIARQRIANDVEGLIKTFDNARHGKTNGKISYE